MDSVEAAAQCENPVSAGLVDNNHDWSWIRNKNHPQVISGVLEKLKFWHSASQRTSSGFSWTGVLVLRRRGRSVVKQDEAVRAMRLRPTFRQWTSEVTGTSEKRARSRDNRAEPLPSLLSMSLTMLRISWRSACRVIPRMFKMADTCFFLHTERGRVWIMRAMWRLEWGVNTIVQLVHCICFGWTNFELMYFQNKT